MKHPFIHSRQIDRSLLVLPLEGRTMKSSSLVSNTPLMSSSVKFLKLQNLLKKSDKMEQFSSPIASTLEDHSSMNLNKKLDLSKDFLLYFSIIKKPLNLLFSMDQFLFEFSKKKYQQKKTGEFLQQLKERKKLSFFYGSLTRKQLVNLFKKAKKFKGSFSATVFSLLERRLDLVLYRSGITRTVVEARQLIKHKKIKVNNNFINIPSFAVNPGDFISMLPETRSVLGGKLTRAPKSPLNSNVPLNNVVPCNSKKFQDFYLKLQKNLKISRNYSNFDGSSKKKYHQTNNSVYYKNLSVYKLLKKTQKSFYQFPSNNVFLEKTESLMNLPKKSNSLSGSSLEKFSNHLMDLQQKNQGSTGLACDFPSKFLSKMLIKLLCTRVQLRCFLTLKRHLGTKDMINKSNNSLPSNPDFTIAFNTKILEDKKSPRAPFKNRVDTLESSSWIKASSKEKQLLILIKRKYFSSKKKPTFIQKNLKKNQPIFLYANQAVSQKAPQISNRHHISTPTRKSSSHLNKQNASHRFLIKELKTNQQKGKKISSTSKRKNLDLYRESFVFFLKCLSISSKFQNFLDLRLKKSLFFNSFYRKNNLSCYTFIKIKPMHLEVSYSLLNLVYLYSPQRINFPFFIDLELIRRSLR